MSTFKHDGAESTTSPLVETPLDGADPSSTKQQAGVSKPLDIVFLQDTTGSQGPYIDSARKAIRDICDKIIASASLSSDQLRFGLIAFRDHPPQDHTYVTRQFGFTNDINVMQKNLKGLIASGGGDGPEAQTAAIAAALEMDWKEDAVKMAVLITDAPPHGLGEIGDGFDKSPDQNDPLELVRQMSQQGITLFVIACEPALSQWRYATDFYTALAQITSGRMFPLLMAESLGDYIVGTAIETIETEKLISEFEKVIVDDVYNQDKKVEDVVGNLQDYMKQKGVQVNTVVVEDVYKASEVGEKNVAAWTNAKNVGAAKAIVEVVPEPRIHAQYIPEAMSTTAFGGFYTGSAYPPAPPPPGAMFSARPLVANPTGMAPTAFGSPSYSSFGADYPPTAPTSATSSVAPSAAFGASPTSMFAPRLYDSVPSAFGYGGPASRTTPAWGASPFAPAPSALGGGVPSPAPSIQRQAPSVAQAHRIVMQSMARQSKVTHEGMVNKATGKVIASSQYAPPSPAYGFSPPPQPPAP